MYEEIIMWTFPLVSIFLSFLLWKEKTSKVLLLFLALGLSLQIFSFGPFLGFSANDGSLFTVFGKGILVGILYFHFGLRVQTRAPKNGTKILVKFLLLSGMVFFTIANLKGLKAADGAASIALIVFPALFFRILKNTGMPNIFSFFVISGTAFLGFIVKWSKLVMDPFNLTPLVWMICFTTAFYLVGNLKEIE